MLYLFLPRGETVQPIEIQAESEKEAFSHADNQGLGIGRMFAVGKPKHSSTRVFQIEEVECYQVFAPKDED